MSGLVKWIQSFGHTEVREIEVIIPTKEKGKDVTHTFGGVAYKNTVNSETRIYLVGDIPKKWKDNHVFIILGQQWALAGVFDSQDVKGLAEDKKVFHLWGANFMLFHWTHGPLTTDSGEPYKTLNCHIKETTP